jgi:hypothetical protein
MRLRACPFSSIGAYSGREIITAKFAEEDALQARTGRRTRRGRTSTFDVGEITEPKHRSSIGSGSQRTG